MKLHERIKNIREEKRISQEAVAFKLELSQSQYSRRENGEVNFLAEEIQKVANALGTKVSTLYGEETYIFNNNNQNGGNFGQYQNIYIPEKLIEQYEQRLKEKDELIKTLKSKK